MLAAPAHRATGVLTSTQADRSIRRINNPLQTLSQLVHSMIDSPHATNTYQRIIGWLFEEPQLHVPQIFLKAGALSKITRIRSVDIDHRAVIQFDRVIKVEMSYDGAASEVARQHSASALLSDLKGLYSPCVSLPHWWLLLSLSFLFLPHLSHLFLFIVISWLLNITGIEKLCNVSPKTFEYLK